MENCQEIINQLPIEIPIKVGSTVYLHENQFGPAFMDRYCGYKPYTVTRVEVRLHSDREPEILFGVEGKDYLCIYNEDTIAFTREQVYENCRKEIQELIPKAMQEYLWGTSI